MLFQQHVFGWRQWKTTGEIIDENIVIKEFAWAESWIISAKNWGLDTTNTEISLEMNREVEDRKLHWMAKIHAVLESKHGSQTLPATQKESRPKIKQLTAVEYISDTDKIVWTS